MTRDRFELDLRAVLREQAPDAAPLALRLRVGEVAARPLPAPAVARLPRLTWVVAALLALLTLLGGLLLVGGALRPAILVSDGCPAGTTPDRSGRVDQPRPAGTLLAAVWNAGDGRSVLAFGTDATWTFDVCSNTWHRSGDAGPWQDTGSLSLAYDIDADVVVGVKGSVWVYDVRNGEWTSRAGPPGRPALAYPRAVYDPLTGLVVILDRTFIWTFDVDSGTWSEVIPVGSAGPDLSEAGYALVTYDASADRIVLYKTGPSAVNSGMQTWEFDLRARSWARSVGSTTPFVNLGFFADDEIVYDDANERTLMFGDGTVAAYDAAADRWAIAYGTPWLGGGVVGYGRYHRRPSALAYDPLNDRLIVFGGEVRTEDRGWVPTDDVIAFDLRSGEWTELLAPSSGGAW